MTPVTYYFCWGKYYFIICHNQYNCLLQLIKWCHIPLPPYTLLFSTRKLIYKKFDSRYTQKKIIIINWESKEIMNSINICLFFQTVLLYAYLRLQVEFLFCFFNFGIEDIMIDDQCVNNSWRSYFNFNEEKNTLILHLFCSGIEYD